MSRKTTTAFLLATVVFLSFSVVSGFAWIGPQYFKLEAPRVFATEQTAVVEDSVSKSNPEDWFYLEDAAAGLMTVEVAWSNSYNLDCYISETASRYTALATGNTGANPETCSYTITAPGTYYIGVRMATPGRTVDTPYTLTVTYYIDGGSTDVTAPLVDITAPFAGATVSDTITITATASDADSGVDYLTCSVGGLSAGSDDSAPYSWTFNTAALANGPADIVVTAYDNAGNSASDAVSVDIYNGDPNPGEGEKIAVFFWASDAGTQENIDEYWAVLQLEGYTVKFDFKDTADFEADFNTVDAYEDPEDTVFFYLFGHGNNNGEDSLTAFAPGTSVVYSSELRVMFDRLDAERIGYLIESCHSGGFPLDFQAAPYLAMSTSDEDHNSYALSTLPGEGLFSDAFFDHVLDGYNAVDSFYFAQQVVFDSARNDRFAQFPIIVDYSDYVWFVD